MTGHLLHTLLRGAETKTGLIPDDFQPSMDTLRKRTGMRLQTLQATRGGYLSA